MPWVHCGVKLPISHRPPLNPQASLPNDISMGREHAGMLWVLGQILVRLVKSCLVNTNNVSPKSTERKFG